MFDGVTHPRLAVFDSATHPALRAPLSERGWRGSAPLIIKVMRQPIPSRRGVAEGRGVSHHQANDQLLHRKAGNCRCFFVKILVNSSIFIIIAL